MPREAKRITVPEIDHLPIGVSRAHGDVPGLFIANKNGRKLWKIKYKKDGKQTKAKIGDWPEVDIETAKLKAVKVLNDVMEGKNVALSISQVRGKTFIGQEDADSAPLRDVYDEWVKYMHSVDGDRKRAFDYEGRIKKHILDGISKLGDMPMNRITEKIMVKELKKVFDGGAKDTARKLHIYLKQLWGYARREEIVTVNIIEGIKLSRDVGKVTKGHYDAIVDPKEFGVMLSEIKEKRDMGIVVRSALLLSAHCFLRSSELRNGRWDEIKWEDKWWDIPAERMKMKIEHRVPLSKQVIAILKRLHEVTGDGELMFPSMVQSRCARPISEATLSVTLKRMGVKHTQHGFRASFRTMADERLRIPVRVIEHQMAHIVRDALGTAYNRTSHIEQRVEMMQQWSDYIEGLAN